MREELLHYIWKHQYFNHHQLNTLEGEEIQIIKAGYYNTNSGPDFKEASIIIDGISWSGSIEIHINASDWHKHKHDTDVAYDNVILHIVWFYDEHIKRTDGTIIPTLILNDKVDPVLIDRHETLLRGQYLIPCAQFIGKVPDIITKMMIERCAMERIRAKSERIAEYYHLTKNDWEEVAYHILLESIGQKVNANTFVMLARIIPFRLLRKYNADNLSIEALLFGGAGFLSSKNVETYYKSLFERFSYLKHKHHIENMMSPSLWQFSRMRPPSFPTVRIAQLAAILKDLPSVFSLLTNTNSIQSFYENICVSPSLYWQTHYHFGKPRGKNKGRLGVSTVNNLIINAVAPLLVYYGKMHDNQSYVDRAIDLLLQVPVENNSIIKMFQNLHIQFDNALDTQGAIELSTNYCKKKNCLNCSIGTSIIGGR